MQNLKLEAKIQDLLDLIALSGAEIQKCYSCQRCTSGCPVAKFMDYPPSKIVKWLNMGDLNRIVKSSAIWLCTSCQTCFSRCPFKIDIPQVIDILKEFAIENSLAKKERSISNFHRLFLNNIKEFGRIFEARLIFDLKLKNMNLFEDLSLGMKMFIKRKLRLSPSKVEAKQELRRLFER